MENNNKNQPKDTGSIPSVKSPVNFLGNTLEVNPAASVQRTLDNASKTISNINETNAKSVDTAIKALVEQNINRAKSVEANNSVPAFANTALKVAGEYADFQEKTEQRKLAAAERDFEIDEARRKQHAQLVQQQTQEANQKSIADQSIFFENSLREFTNKNLWRELGGNGFITMIETNLKNDKDLTPEAYANLMTRAYRVTNEYEEAERRQASEAATKLQDAIAEERQVFYTGRALPIVKKLENATTLEQSSYFEQEFQEQVLAPLFADGQLTDVQKYIGAGKLGNLFNEAYSKKIGAYENSQSAFRQWQQASPLYQEAYARFQQTNDQVALQADLNSIKLRFPLAEGFTLSPGEALKRNNELLEIRQQQQKLSQAERESNPLQLSAIAQRYYIATALLDRSQLPIIKAELQNDALYAQIEATVNEYDDYNSKRGELDVRRARLNTEIAQLSLSTSEDFYQMAISARKSQNETQTNVLQQALALSSLTPEQKLLFLNDPSAARNNADINKLISELAATKRSGINGIINAKRAELNAENQALNSRYPNLNNLGLFGASPGQLQRYREQGRGVAQQEILNYIQRLQQQRQQFNDNASFNGQQPNFSSGGTREPLTNPGVLGRVRVRVGNSSDQVSIISPLGNAGRNIGVFTSGFGMRWGRMHHGIDIAAPRGTTVHSVVSGVVVEAGHNDGYGNQVTVRGDNGMFYRYAHSMPVVARGTRISVGQHIATIDGSGRGTGDHVHFEVRRNAGFNHAQDAIDPIPHLIELTKYVPTSNLKSLRQDTSPLTRQNTYAQKPLVMAGNNGVVAGNRFRNIDPGGSIEPSQTSIGTRRGVDGASWAMQSRFTGNKPLTRTSTPAAFSGGIRNDPEANYNYHYLASNPRFRRKLARVADELGTSAVFLADIIAQESKFTANMIHSGGNNVGITGFGRDSGVGNINQIVRMSAYDQLDVLKRYIEQSIPRQHRNDVRTLWAGIRMGTSMRNKVWSNPNSYNPKLNDTGKTWFDEVNLLGKDAGRIYFLPGYHKRSESIKPNTQIAYGWGKSTLDGQLGAQGISNILIQDM